MKSIEFKHQNVVFAKDQPEYLPLPALKIPNDEQGRVVTCWGLSFKERLRVLFTGKIWLSLLSFNNPLTPTFMSTNKRDHYDHPDFHR